MDSGLVCRAGLAHICVLGDLHPATMIAHGGLQIVSHCPSRTAGVLALFAASRRHIVVALA